jgi:hypothetical protein
MSSSQLKTRSCKNMCENPLPLPILFSKLFVITKNGPWKRDGTFKINKPFHQINYTTSVFLYMMPVYGGIGQLTLQKLSEATSTKTEVVVCKDFFSRFDCTNFRKLGMFKIIFRKKKVYIEVSNYLNMLHFLVIPWSLKLQDLYSIQIFNDFLKPSYFNRTWYKIYHMMLSLKKLP